MVVTISPEDRGRATKSLAITEVRSHFSGRLFDARRFIERPTYGRLIQVRNLLQEARYRKRLRITCAFCGRQVYLVSMPKKEFFFRHGVEDGQCPAITRSKLSADEINARKYLGARESPAHRQTKEFIERSLRADAAFADIQVEARWTSGTRTGAYRQPDVQAVFGTTRVAFEVQLSTTFVSVVVGRREFYRGENAMLIWVLRRFDPEDRRLTVDDLFFPNNSNTLVVDDETVKLSEEQQAFIARCWYREPYLGTSQVEHRWSSELVKVREMTFDVPGQRAFSFDVQSRKTELHQELAERARMERFTNAREGFFRYCDYWSREGDIAEIEEAYDYAIQPLVELGIPMPPTISEGRLFARHVMVLRSIEVGEPVGFRYDKLVQVLHTVAESYKDFIYFVGHALNIYDRNALVEMQDPRGKWKARRATIKVAMKAGDPVYQPTMEWARAFPLLFPELAAIPKWSGSAAPHTHPVTVDEVRA